MSKIHTAIRELAKQVGLGKERADELVGEFEDGDVSLEPAHKVWLEGYQVTAHGGLFVLTSEDGSEVVRVAPSGLGQYFDPEEDETFFALLGLRI